VILAAIIESIRLEWYVGSFYLVNIGIKRHCHGAEGSGDVVRVADIVTTQSPRPGNRDNERLRW
jgi:hypothetical protein